MTHKTGIGLLLMMLITALGSNCAPWVLPSWAPTPAKYVASTASSTALLNMGDSSRIQGAVVWSDAPPSGTQISSIAPTSAVIAPRYSPVPKITSVVPIKSNKNALMVDALINGHVTGTFIVDTGATYTSISRQMAEQMGLDLENAERVYVTTVNGRISVPKVRIKTLSLNGLEAHNIEATVIDVGHGSSFSGLLGLSFIKQFTLTINPEAGHLIFEQM